MPRYLIKVSQPSAGLARKHIEDSLRYMGSHFATHADWTRRDGPCTASLVVETVNREGALGIVPPNMRRNAKVYQLGPIAA